jgi:hypothetical protein
MVSRLDEHFTGKQAERLVIDEDLGTLWAPLNDERTQVEASFSRTSSCDRSTLLVEGFALGELVIERRSLSMSPEVLEAKGDVETDLFSANAALIDHVTGTTKRYESSLDLFGLELTHARLKEELNVRGVELFLGLC